MLEDVQCFESYRRNNVYAHLLFKAITIKRPKDIRLLLYNCCSCTVVILDCPYNHNEPAKIAPSGRPLFLTKLSHLWTSYYSRCSILHLLFSSPMSFEIYLTTTRCSSRILQKKRNITHFLSNRGTKLAPSLITRVITLSLIFITLRQIYKWSIVRSLLSRK